MLTELKELLMNIDPTHEKINNASQWCQDYIRANPSTIQSLVETWSSAVETSSQKIALIFLANDVIQNAKNDMLKQVLQLCLPRAFSLASGSHSAIQDIKKVLRVWDERGIYPSSLIQDWEKLIERKSSRHDNSSALFAISLAKHLKKVKVAEEELETHRDNEENKGRLRVAREELVIEIINVMKKVDHVHLDICLYLQIINQRLEKLDT